MVNLHHLDIICKNVLKIICSKNSVFKFLNLIGYIEPLWYKTTNSWFDKPLSKINSLGKRHTRCE